MALLIDYYVSLNSPWTHLGAARIEALAAQHGAELRIWPVDFGTIFAGSGGLPAKGSAMWGAPIWARIAFSTESEMPQVSRSTIRVVPSAWPTRTFCGANREQRSTWIKTQRSASGAVPRPR